MENAVTQVSAFSCLMGPCFGPSFESVLYPRGRFQMVYNGRAARAAAAILCCRLIRPRA